VEGDNVRVVDDGSGDEPEPWSPARRWRLAALAAIGLLLAALLLAPALRSTEEPPSYPPEAAPATTTTELTTTTIALELVMDNISALVEPEVRSFCERASPLTTERILDINEWVESIEDADWFTYRPVEDKDYGNHVNSVVFFEFELWEASADLDWERTKLLGSVGYYMSDAHEALHIAVDAAYNGEPEEWTYQVAQMEIFCAKAAATIEAMVGMSRE
jgi:hypothetical protein